MHMVAPTKLWTLDEVLALPEDGRRFELIDGVLLVNGVAVPRGDLAALDPAMTPSPTWTHQGAAFESARLLAPFVEQHGVGRVVMAPADVPLLTGQLVQPDVFVVPLTAAGKAPTNFEEAGALLVAVEVLSPSTARSDRVRKRAFYQRAGVPEYWIVDIDARLIERWTPNDARPETLTSELVWQPAGFAESLRIDLPRYFASVLGDPAID